MTTPTASRRPGASPAEDEDPADPFFGRHVGRCWIVARLGEGAYGTVYRAIDEERGRPVAIKIVKPDRAANGRALHRFLQGAIAASEVAHPNVVRIHRVGRDERTGLHYIVMEHLRGRSLQSLLEEQGAMEWRRVLPWMFHACDGLHAVHEKSVVHRDVKPDNLVLGPDGIVRVTDVGFARYTGGGGGTHVVGTPRFMAPEQFQGDALDRRCDVFALGVTLYYLVSGRFPWEGRTPAEVVLAAVSLPPVPLPEFAPSVTAGLWPVVKRMIRPQPDQRPATTSEVKRDLAMVLAMG